MSPTLRTSIYNQLCFNCILKQRTSASSVRTLSSSTKTTSFCKRNNGEPQRRFIHHGKKKQQQLAATAASPPATPPDMEHWPIRDRLAKWQQENGNPMSDLLGLDTPFGVKNVVADNYGERGLRKTDDPQNDDEDEDVDTSRIGRLFDEDANDYGGIHMQMGDLVELFSSSSVTPTIAVYVRSLSLRQIQLITMRGKWVVVDSTHINFSVPGFLDPKWVEPIVPYLPGEAVIKALLGQAQIMDSSIPRELTGPIVRTLLDFHREAEKVYRENAAILDNAHEALAHSTDLRFGTLEKITDRLIGKTSAPRMAAMYAVRRALIQSGMAFGIDRRSHRTTGVFQIRSKEQLKYLVTVRGWLREYQEYEISSKLQAQSVDTSSSKPIQPSEGARIVLGFLEKAKLAIAASRKYRSAEFADDGAIGPSNQRFPLTSADGTTRSTSKVHFTNEERMIIQLFEYLCVQRILFGEDGLTSLLPLVLRGTKMYEDYEDYQNTPLRLGNRASYVFLQEIGVYTPWENLIHYDVNLLLPSSQHSKPLQQLATTLEQMDPSKIDLKDSMTSLRKELTDVTAYAIDSSDAAEIDDALSIERIPGSDSTAWIHVHIANPTAFIERESIFARMAAHLTETFYSPEKSVSLIPSWLSQRMFSLAAGRPCLTFSSKVNLNGEILEVKIEPGKLHNVVSLTYDQLPAILEFPSVDREKPEPMVVGGPLPSQPAESPATISDAQAADLQLLFKFAQGRQAYRKRQGAFSFESQPPGVSVHTKDHQFGLNSDLPDRHVSMQTHGDPIIAIYPRPWSNPFQSDQTTQHLTVVPECMMLAGEASARWCAARNIPIPYRGMVAIPGQLPRTKVYEDVIQSSLDKHGFITVEAGYTYIRKIGKSKLQTTPFYHPMLGLDYYTKITSPLRRYGDMIAHWQIEAALREEHKLGLSSSKSSTTSTAIQRQDYLPFSKASMENIITRLLPRERLISIAKARSVNHWIAHFLFRAYHFKEYELPERMRVAIVTLQSNSTLEIVEAKGTIVDWGLGVTIQREVLKNEAPELEFREGDIWEAEIAKVTPYYPRVMMTAIRLLERVAD